MNITFSNQRHATTHKQTNTEQDAEQTEEQRLHPLHYRPRCFLSIFFWVCPWSFNLASRTAGTKTSAQGARRKRSIHSSFGGGSDDTKYLCSNCRKGHDHTVPLLGNIDCVLTKWPTWGAGCCSVKLFADKGAEFTVGVYKYEHGVDGCVPSEGGSPLVSNSNATVHTNIKIGALRTGRYVSYQTG